VTDIATKVRGPNIICFGMQRAGTRWLFDQLAAHDDVWMPPVKEIGHFVDDCFKQSNFNVETKSPELPSQRRTAEEHEAFRLMFTPERRVAGGDEWYLELFRPKAGRHSGDISPEYSILNKARARDVAALCPAAQYVFLLRDPVDRFWSAANLHVRAGRHPPDALSDPDSVDRLLSTPLYRQRSYPSRIWLRWRSAVPDRQLAFFFFEDIRDRPAIARARILAFCGLDPARVGLEPDFNRKFRQERMPLVPAMRRHLTERFMPEYRRCAEMFGGHAEEWLAAALRS